MPPMDAARLTAHVVSANPQTCPQCPQALESDESRHRLAAQEFRGRFLWGRINPWRHNSYLQAAYMALLEPANKDRGILDVATAFAADVNRLKQRNSRFQLQPESRTLTVFWLYHVRLAISALQTYQLQEPELHHFNRILHYVPELVNDKLPTSYYSPDILKSEQAEKFWMLPDLRDLTEPPRHPDPRFREKFTKTQHEDPERVLRFAFSVVKRYLRPGETRRRSWFIKLAFAALQQQTTRLRSMRPCVSSYSETRSYFYLQLVHAALSQFTNSGKGDLIQTMSYPLFKETFRISPSAWRGYYTPDLWGSLWARARFVPPDLQLLPDVIHPPNFRLEIDSSLADPNEPFHRLGLIPELPSSEVLRFHQAILLEDAKALAPILNPDEVTAHAHLLRYIHTHLVLPAHTTPESTLQSLFRQHLALLTSTSPLPRQQITTTLALTHHSLSQPTLKNTDYFAPLPTIPFRPSYTDPTTGKFIRHHNCPCHHEQVLPYDIGPNAVCYPRDPPYEHPLQFKHECYCHAAEELDHDLFAGVCARQYGELEDGEKRRRGEVGTFFGRDITGDRAGEGFEEWLRGDWGLVLCWDEAWRVASGREGELGIGRVGADTDTGQGVDSRVGGEEKGGKGVKAESGAVDELGRAGKGDGADEGTLVGEVEEEDGADDVGEMGDEWEVVSQVTLCSSANLYV